MNAVFLQKFYPLRYKTFKKSENWSFKLIRILQWNQHQREGHAPSNQNSAKWTSPAIIAKQNPPQEDNSNGKHAKPTVRNVKRASNNAMKRRWKNHVPPHQNSAEWTSIAIIAKQNPPQEDNSAGKHAKPTVRNVLTASNSAIMMCGYLSNIGFLNIHYGSVLRYSY